MELRSCVSKPVRFSVHLLLFHIVKKPRNPPLCARTTTRTPYLISFLSHERDEVLYSKDSGFRRVEEEREASVKYVFKKIQKKGRRAKNQYFACILHAMC